MISPVGLNRNNVYSDIFHKYTGAGVYDPQLGAF